MELSETLLKACFALTALLNPLSVTPIFLSLNEDKNPKDFIPIALKASITVGCVLVISILLGKVILSFFGISMYSFTLGGGILIFLVALSMVNAKPARKKITHGELVEAEGENDISIVPLGFPLLAGPGTVSTVIIYSDKISGNINKGLYILFALLLTILIYQSLKYSKLIFEKLGRTGINVVTRVMGILLVGISIEIITKSIKNIFSI